MKNKILVMAILALFASGAEAGHLSKKVRQDGYELDVFQSQRKATHKIKRAKKADLSVVGTEIQIRSGAIKKLLKAKHKDVRIKVILSGQEEVLLLTKSEPFKFETGNLFYHGIVKGDDESIAQLSFFDGKITGYIKKGEKQYDIDSKGSQTFVQDLEGQESPILQEAIDMLVPPNASSEQESSKNEPSISQLVVNPNTPVQVGLVVDYKMRQTMGGTAQATQHAQASFALAVALYQNDDVLIQSPGIKVWETQDPYASFNEMSASVLLSGFATKEPMMPGAHLMHLLTIRPGMGGIAYLSVLCNPYYFHGLSSIYSAIDGNNVYSWVANVITHELGHNLSSPHTHACKWNVNGLANQAIDGCASPEGTCARGPVPTTRIGTMMSYCHLSWQTDLRLGFGPQPKAKIQSFIQAATCLGGVSGPDTVAPIVSILSPPSGSTVVGVGANRLVSITADARDDRAMSRVEFQISALGVNETLADYDYPYGIEWNSKGKPNQMYAVRAKAFDAAGNASQYTGNVMFTLNNAPQDVTKPVVTITSPPSGTQWMSGVKTFAASATDNVGVTFMSMYINDQLFGSQSNVSSMSRNMDYGYFGAGPAVFKVQAKDLDGNIGEASLNFTIGGTLDVTKPTVTITSPANNAEVSGSFAINATASDDNAVSKVDFYFGSTLIGSDNSTPYSVVVPTSVADNGSKVLKATAFDAAGNSGSFSLIVNVNNPTQATFGIVSATVGQDKTVSDSTKRNWIDVTLTGLVGTPSIAGKAATSTAWTTKSGADVVNLGNNVFRTYYWNPNTNYSERVTCVSCVPSVSKQVDFKTLP